MIHTDICVQKDRERGEKERARARFIMNFKVSRTGVLGVTVKLQ
jgi:hypothetical protein